MAQSDANKTKYDELLNDLSNSRQELAQDIVDVKQCKDAVIGIATNSTDYRSRYSKEDRIKTISGFYSTLLGLRQEYNRNIISEIELRRKLEKGDDGELELDITKIIKQIENSRKSADKGVQTIAQIAKAVESSS